MNPQVTTYRRENAGQCLNNHRETGYLCNLLPAHVGNHQYWLQYPVFREGTHHPLVNDSLLLEWADKP